MTALPLTSLGTILMVLLTFYFSIRVGRMRGKVLAPATSGDPEFEKAFRIHYNTIEQLILFLPMLWLSVGYFGDTVGGALALVLEEAFAGLDEPLCRRFLLFRHRSGRRTLLGLCYFRCPWL